MIAGSNPAGPTQLVEKPLDKLKEVITTNTKNTLVFPI
ncbi:hypothetical protein YG5714_3012 [Sulfolobus islandicus Y.G.57.14]|uniref:Uncharacterized protein n=1 Tax=Saccharolobus islandicus (strain Y.G.57.14 / Yellowstone \|nr:hypothetical protein YG5714_3012 [Sulfolobus islandicus Y.G.57.14]